MLQCPHDSPPCRKLAAIWRVAQGCSGPISCAIRAATCQLVAGVAGWHLAGQLSAKRHAQCPAKAAYVCPPPPCKSRGLSADRHALACPQCTCPIANVATAMQAIPYTRVLLRPTVSPMWPKSSAPKGLAAMAIANTVQSASQMDTYVHAQMYIGWLCMFNVCISLLIIGCLQHQQQQLRLAAHRPSSRVGIATTPRTGGSHREKASFLGGNLPSPAFVSWKKMQLPTCTWQQASKDSQPVSLPLGKKTALMVPSSWE